MPQYNNDEEKIIRMLKELPKIEDHRSKEEIYQNIKTQVSSRPARRTRPLLIPALSSVAALLIVLIVLPFLKDFIPLSDKPIQENAELAENFTENDSGKNLENDNPTVENKVFDNPFDLRTAAYIEQVEDNEVFTFGVLTSNALVIPVSTIFPRENRADWLTRLKNAAKDLESKKLDFHVPVSLFEALEWENNNTLRLTINDYNKRYLETGHYIDLILRFTFQHSAIDTILIRDEKGNIYNDTGHYGEIPELQVTNPLGRAYFLLKKEEGLNYLFPVDLGKEDIESALKLMKHRPNDLVTPSIPKNIQLNVVSTDFGQLTLRFDKSLDLETGDPIKNMLMIEAILLTAKDFGFQTVYFENIKPKIWNGFEFEHPIIVPLAPNFIK